MIIHLKGYPTIQVDTIAEYAPSADAEEQDISTVADIAGSLGGTYFHLYSADNATVYTVWIDVDDGSTAPNIPYTTLIEVDISANDSANTIATAVSAAIDDSEFPDFDASVTTNVVSVVNAANGSARLAHDPTKQSEFISVDSAAALATGFTFVQTTKGISNNALPSSLILYQIDGRIKDQKAYQQGNKFIEYPYKENTISIIVTERQILRVYED